MSLSLSQKDKTLLIGVVGALILFLSWYFVYTPLTEKTAVLETQNVELKAKADLYQSINANLPKYEDGIAANRQRIVEISNRYPVHISREDEIMFLANMENVYPKDLAVENINMSNMVEVFVENNAGANNATAEATATTDATASEPATTDSEVVVPEVHLYKQPSEYTFRCTYKGAKDMVQYIISQSNKKGIEGISLSFDSETGNLAGAMELNQYYMVGIEKEYQSIPVPVVPKGVKDVFHTVNGSAGVDAVLVTE